MRDRERSPDRPDRKVGWWRPGAAELAVGVTALLSSQRLRDDDWWAPAAAIIASGLVLLPAMRRALRRRTEHVMADHLLVLCGAFILYYVLGALLIPLGPRDQAEHALSGYWLDVVLAMRVTAVNAVGLGLALISGSLCGTRWVSRLARRSVALGAGIPRHWVTVGFMFVGGITALYVLALDLGLHGDGGGVVSGTVRALSNLALVAIVMAIAYRGPGNLGLGALAVLLAACLGAAGLLQLNKSAVLFPMAAVFAGMAWRTSVRRVMAPAIVTLLAAFLLIGSPVGTARNTASTTVDLGERTAILSASLAGQSPVASDDGGYQHWARFSYLGPQSAAIDMYDSGRGGDDYTKLGWVFLPRALFPGKPIITASSREFYYRLSGSETSSTGQGVFVSGYYDLGWVGAAVVGVVVGLILSCTSAFALEVFRAGAMLWLPVAVMGSFMAFRIDGNFLADYWGPFAFICYAAGAGAALHTILPKGLVR